MGCPFFSRNSVTFCISLTQATKTLHKHCWHIHTFFISVTAKTTTTITAATKVTPTKATKTKTNAKKTIFSSKEIPIAYIIVFFVVVAFVIQRPQKVEWSQICDILKEYLHFICLKVLFSVDMIIANKVPCTSLLLAWQLLTASHLDSWLPCRGLTSAGLQGFIIDSILVMNPSSTGRTADGCYSSPDSCWQPCHPW